MTEGINLLLENYLKRTGRTRTLIELRKDLDLTPSSKIKTASSQLSFAIIKPPKRPNIENSQIKQNKKKRTEKMSYKMKQELGNHNFYKISYIRILVEIPKEFLTIARKFGIADAQADFFYEHRDSFHWELKEKQLLYCHARRCSYTTEIGPKALVAHMIEKHDYKEIPCTEAECSFVAYSQESIRTHLVKFHGDGKRQPKLYGDLKCKFKSCVYITDNSNHLQRHHDVHENKHMTCPYCPYRTVQIPMMRFHFLLHFNIRNHLCDLCDKCFKNTTELNQHKIRDHYRDFYCNSCHSQFDKIGTLRKHTKICVQRKEVFTK